MISNLNNSSEGYFLCADFPNTIRLNIDFSYIYTMISPQSQHSRMTQSRLYLHSLFYSWMSPGACAILSGCEWYLRCESWIDYGGLVQEDMGRTDVTNWIPRAGERINGKTRKRNYWMRIRWGLRLNCTILNISFNNEIEGCFLNAIQLWKRS